MVNSHLVDEKKWITQICQNLTIILSDSTENRFFLDDNIEQIDIFKNRSIFSLAVNYRLWNDCLRGVSIYGRLKCLLISCQWQFLRLKFYAFPNFDCVILESILWQFHLNFVVLDWFFYSDLILWSEKVQTFGLKMPNF